MCSNNSMSVGSLSGINRTQSLSEIPTASNNKFGGRTVSLGKASVLTPSELGAPSSFKGKALSERHVSVITGQQ